MGKGRFKFDVAYNFEEHLAEELQKAGNVHCVYAKLNSDLVGGGRPSSALPNISMEELGRHIKKVHDCGMKFNYLLNTMCVGNQELEKEYFENVIEYLNKLCDLGIDSVTVANPFISNMIKQRFSDRLEVCLSVNVRVSSLQQIKYWEEFGIDEITLDQIVNRDFDALEKILLHTKETGTRIRLFANNICLHDCPMRSYHGLANSHASQGNHKEREHLNYYYYKCTAMKVRDPYKLIAATWIRPDDLPYYYEVMEKAGNHNVLIKLAERSSTTDYLVKILNAYNDEHYDGNLMDIIYPIQGKLLIPPKKEGAKKEEYYTPEMMQEVVSTFNLDWFNIDNRKLDGFLEGFVKHNNCRDKICSSKNEGSNSCTYCYQWAKKAVICDEVKQKQYLNNVNDIINRMETGKMFK